MTEQEAINRISYLKNKADVALSTTRSNCSWAKEDVTGTINALDIAIKALEKQMPKKPFKTMDENNPYYKYMPWCCPCCRETLYEDAEWGEQEFDYCTECGQKLDWGE